MPTVSAWRPCATASSRFSGSWARAGRRHPSSSSSRSGAARFATSIARGRDSAVTDRATGAPFRAARFLPPDVIVERGTDGTVRARSPHPLGPYPPTMIERLAHWAETAPDRIFLAERDARRPLAARSDTAKRSIGSDRSPRRCSIAGCRPIGRSRFCRATASSTGCSRSRRCTSDSRTRPSRRPIHSSPATTRRSKPSGISSIRRSSSPTTAPRSSARCGR